LGRAKHKPPEYYVAIFNTADCLMRQVAASGDKVKAADAEKLLKATLVLNPNLSGPEMVAQYKAQLNLSEKRLNDLYVAFNKNNNAHKDISSPLEMTKMLKEAGMLEAVMAAWENKTTTEVAKVCSDIELVTGLVKDIFETLDQDHSGTVSFPELLTGISIILEGSNTEKMFRFRFKATDLNNDGQLNFEEAKRLSGLILNIVAAALNTALTQTSQKFREAGATEKDLRDLRAAFDRILKGSNLADKETEILFEFADKDKSGGISEEEYVAFMLDKDAQSKRDKAFSKLVGPAAQALGVQLGLELVELGQRIKARYGR